MRPALHMPKVAMMIDDPATSLIAFDSSTLPVSFKPGNRSGQSPARMRCQVS